MNETKGRKLTVKVSPLYSPLGAKPKTEILGFNRVLKNSGTCFDRLSMNGFHSMTSPVRSVRPFGKLRAGCELREGLRISFPTAGKARPGMVLGSSVQKTAAAIGRSGLRIPALLLIAVMAHSIGCARRFPVTEVTPIKSANPAELQRYLLSRKPDVTQFRSRGPFDVIESRDVEIPLLSGLTVEADLYLCAAARKAPPRHRVTRLRQFQGRPCLPSDALGLVGHA